MPNVNATGNEKDDRIQAIADRDRHGRALSRPGSGAGTGRARPRGPILFVRAKARALQFGLPARCHVSLLPLMWPFVGWERLLSKTAPEHA